MSNFTSSVVSPAMPAAAGPFPLSEDEISAVAGGFLPLLIAAAVAASFFLEGSCEKAEKTSTPDGGTSESESQQKVKIEANVKK